MIYQDTRIWTPASQELSRVANGWRDSFESHGGRCRYCAKPIDIEGQRIFWSCEAFPGTGRGYEEDLWLHIACAQILGTLLRMDVADASKIPKPPLWGEPIARAFGEQVTENEVSCVAACQSPIEKVMGVALIRHGLNPVFQYEVTAAAGKKYRLDIKMEESLVAVECDGHDFHERTKEQARNDKSRDRALLALGYSVLHFTGSEIHANAKGCAEQVSQLLVQRNEHPGYPRE